MAQKDAHEGPPPRGGVAKLTSTDTSTQEPCGDKPKRSRLIFRNGAWYADDQRCGSYREALKRTLRVAGVEQPKSPPPAKRAKSYARPERLETRAWWEAFLDARAIREAKRIADERALKDAEEERIWAAVKAGRLERPDEHYQKGSCAQLPFLTHGAHA